MCLDANAVLEYNVECCFMEGEGSRKANKSGAYSSHPEALPPERTPVGVCSLVKSEEIW